MSCFKFFPGQVNIIVRQIQGIHNINLVCTIKYWCCDVESKCFGSQRKVDLQYLSDIHTWRYTQWVQHDVKRTSVRKERHIFYWKYTGNNTLVTMTSGHLITYRDLSLLCDVDTDCLVNSRWKFISIFSCKYFCIYNDTVFTMRYFQRSISYFTSFFSKDCTKKSFLCCQFCLSLRSNFADKNISCTNLSTDTDNTSLIQIFQCIITYAWNITCNFFWSELCITGFCFIFFDMNRCVNVILYQTLT